MAQELAKQAPKAVGLNQTLKALRKGLAVTVYLAQDADSALQDQLKEAAADQAVPLVMVPTMKELGRSCGIQVPAAAAALLASP